MKIIKKEFCGIQQIYNTNVEKVRNYVGSNVVNHNCVVDSTYRGEIHISLINTSNSTVKIYEDQKIVQFIETPIILSDIVSVEGMDEKEFFAGTTSTRGDGGFGSSDIKNKKK